MANYFITGTDTDVGKTTATAAIISNLLEKNINVVAMKPVQTGCGKIGNKFTVPDLDFISKITGLTQKSDEQKLLAPYRYEPACSPHLAAGLTSDQISLEIIISAYKKLTKIYDSIIVEGAGGIMVPLNNNEMMLDLMKALNLPIILTARPGLGTINHTLLSIEVLQSAGLKIAGIIFCATTPLNGDFIESNNVKTIEKISRINVIGTIPFITALGTDKVTPEMFKKIISESLDLNL